MSGQQPDTTFYHYTKDQLDSTTGAVAQSYRYDANGSMTHRGADIFRYDAKMRLRQALVPGQPLNAMTYDPMGLRVQAVSSEGKIGYLIDPTSQMGQFNTMSVTAEYMNGAKSREFGLGTRPDEVLWEENSEGLFYLLYDGLGSVVAATNANGQVVAQMAYDAFGKVFSQSEQSQDVRYGYTGRPMDKDIGLQYNRARHYDADVGRWNRTDEWRGNLEEPASRNRYVYAHQNPINFNDPSGYFVFVLIFPFMAAVAAGLLKGVIMTLGVAILALFTAMIIVHAAEYVISVYGEMYREVENEYNDMARHLIGSPTLPNNIDPRNICAILKWLRGVELGKCGNDKRQRNLVSRKFDTAEKAAGCRNAQKRSSD